MKTLVVLTVLASIAVAAPPFWANEFKNTHHGNWPEYTRRDKKSPQGYFFAESAPFTHVGVPPAHIEGELESSAATGRSFGLKKTLLKPTIIKRPSGYHYYRDSAEARAQEDPSEDCSKQFKVKVCNGEKTARSIKEETHEDNMESSLKMAKEAIEHLQRDLKNKELSPKSASWNERDVHEEIEVARKAIDQVHKNFGNLESMSLHSNLHDETLIHSTDGSGKTHEERASQWKEHAKSFQSHIEGARNMEDIMKSASHHESSLHFENIDTTKLMKNSNQNEHLLHEAPLKLMAKEMKETHERHAHSETKTQSDMKVTGTKMEESKMEQSQHFAKEKSAEVNMDLQKGMSEMKNFELEKLKAKASDLTNDKMQPIKEADQHESHIDEKLRTTKENEQNEKSKPASNIQPMLDVNLQSGRMVDTFRKSSEQKWDHEMDKHLKQPKNSFTETQSMEHSAVSMQSNHIKDNFVKNQLNQEKKFAHTKASMKSADNENTKKMINDHHDVSSHLHVPSEKSVDDLGQDKTELSNMRWAPMTNEHLEKSTQMKAAADFHNNEKQLGAMHHHTEPTVQPSNQIETKSHPVHGHSLKIHENEHSMNHAMNHAKTIDEFNGIMSPNLKTSIITDHAKSADLDGLMLPNMPNWIDFTGKSAMDLMQWSHKMDGGRSAYGGYGGGLSGGSGSGGAGAVGVFPNAHVGGCAVPLLLSCSPSVVSGSLAKSGYGSSYGSAPAYKSAEERNLHNKRDTKKIKDGLNKKNIKQKTSKANKQ
ncbi:uncharacterized protein LOC106137986 [Amyelois transitella]|uniref:uncharacterized protein LOC106137986 n=1 Tax=Amyelois transitella TaxID=680683 RepID=UPI00067CC8A5|nr:uncharacterized protein LOC106137986 [Amyelois transitella]